MMQSHNSVVGARPSPWADDWRWTAVARRDRSADGQFVYAVLSTGVYCRPSCPSRRPRRDRVRFFDVPAAATRAGFRPCRRCRPDRPVTDEAIVRAADYLTRHADEPVTLAALGKVARLSPFHLQRRFKQAVGVSPREFHAARRAERFRRELQSGRDVTAASYEAGYGSPSRLYDAAPTGGIAPSAYRRGGLGSEIGFVMVRSPLGWLLVAATPTGLCAVRLGDSRRALEGELRREFPRAVIQPDRFIPAAWLTAITGQLRGAPSELALPLDVRATAFQWRVWRALQKIPAGQTRSYSEVARQIGRPSAVRAVARACATNPVALIVPCHRVVAKDGSLGGYRWGTARKARLLEREGANAQTAGLDAEGRRTDSQEA